MHGSSALITAELLLAKASGVPITLSHSHNTTCSHIKVHKVLKHVLSYVVNRYLACGNLAGKWMYGDKKFTVIPNAFKTEYK